VETNGKSRTIVLSPTSTWKIAKNLSFTVNVQTFMRRETPEETQLPFIAIGTPQSIVNAFDPARGYPIPGSAVAGKIGLSLSPYGSIDVDQGYNDGSDAWLNGTFLFPRNFSYASDHDYRITDLGSIESELDLNLGEHWRARANFDYNYFGQHQYLTGYGGVFIAPPNTLLYTNGAWSLAPGYAALTSAQQLQVAANFLTALVNNPQSAESQLQNGMSPPLVQPRRIRLWDVYGHDNTVQVEAAGTYKFRWGDFKPLLGAYTNQNYIVNLIHQTNGTAAFPYAHPWDVNPSSPTYYIDPTAPAIPNAVPFYVAQYGLAYSSNQAAYALLNFDFFKHRFFVITGARYNQASERTTNYLGTTPLAVYGQGLRTHYTTPQAGIGYKLTPDLMLYASYSTSFTLPTATYITGVGYDATGAPIPLPLKAAKPTIGEGYEVGLKTNFLGGRIASTLSAYQVTQNDVFTSSTGVFTGPTGISNSVLVSFQGSTLRSRGIEYEVTFSPLDNWQVFASVTDMDCRYTAEPIGYLYFLGQAPLYVSRYLGNLWTRYTFVRGPKGLWIGGGLKYMSRHVDEGGNYFVDPANTDVEAAIGYEWQWGKVKYTLTANGMNLANQLLLSTENAISIPRRVVVKLSATF
jgi:iron complex outermembrane receptor protein